MLIVSASNGTDVDDRYVRELYNETDPMAALVRRRMWLTSSVRLAVVMADTVDGECRRES